MFFSPQFKKFQKIDHCFFTKNNGFSNGIYKSLNCGLSSNDNKVSVIKNLKYVSNKINVNYNNLILMNQTHSNKVILVDDLNKKIKKFNSDAIVTQVKGLALGVLTADCVPIILYDKKNEIIGCIHSGWKGFISGVIKNTVNVFKEINKKNDFFACVGPCIEKKNYEVDLDLVKKFTSKSKKNLNFFLKKKDNKFLFDLRGCVNAELKELGIKNIYNIDFDTFQDQDNFFSYRRSQKKGELDYGRCISTICLKT